MDKSICPKCGDKRIQRYKPVFSERNGRRMKGGWRCLRCYKEYAKKDYMANPEKIKERNRRNGRKRRSKPGYALKKGARAAVYLAIKEGRMARQPCEKCGDPKSQAHHWSYEREHWFDVKFLCAEHHGEVHRRRGSP